MSIFTVENQGVNTYLVYKVTAEDEFDSLSFGMLANNKIRGIAPILFTQVDTDKYLKYNISSKIPVSKYFKGTVTRKRLLDVFSGIASAVMAAEEYMVDTSLFIFNIDYIYVDATTNETTLICIPVVNCSHSTVDLQMFYKQIMYSSQFDQSENCDYIAPIINYLNSTPVFSILDFKNLVDKLNFIPSHNISTVSDAVRRQPMSTEMPVQKAPASAPDIYADSRKNTNLPENGVTVPPSVSKAHSLPVSSNGSDVPSSLPPVPQKTSKSKKQKADKSVMTSSAVSQTTEQEEKQVTLLTLLTKFSKENLELYKEQKAKGKSIEKGKSPKAAKKQQISPVNFAIPGKTPSINNVQANSVETSEKPSGSTVGRTNEVSQRETTVKSGTYQQAVVLQSKHIGVQQANFGETTVLSGNSAGETTVLGVTPAVTQPVAHLVRVKTGEKIAINKPAFRIGKEKSYVDYFISDNTAISRSHADIIMRGGEYYIVDLNSTNHTFINETIIESGIENHITAGDKIRFGNEVFDFIML